MDPLARRFVGAALVWLVLGTVLGLIMAVPGWHGGLQAALGGRLIPAHAHMQLFGYVMMTIFGVALHILPRFEGRPLPRPGLARWVFWLANGGLLLFAWGQLTGRHGWTAAGGVLMTGAVLLFAAVVGGLLWSRRPGARGS